MGGDAEGHRLTTVSSIGLERVSTGSSTTASWAVREQIADHVVELVRMGEDGQEIESGAHPVHAFLLWEISTLISHLFTTLCVSRLQSTFYGARRHPQTTPKPRPILSRLSSMRRS